MAHTSGTATGYADLMDKFVTFVTTGLASGQNWTKLKDDVETGYDRNVYFEAPGLSADQQIFIQMASLHDTGADTYNIGLWAATGYSSGLGFLAQPGISPGCYLLTWNTSIPYWFVADGRGARIVAKVATVYESAAAGLIVPYASPSEYAYPMFVGGCSTNSAKRYSDTSAVHSAFWNPIGDTSGINLGVDTNSGSFLRLPGGNWVPVSNNSTEHMRVWPYSSVERIGHVFGGTDYALMPLVLHTGGAAGGTPDSQRGNMGELDGVFFVSGFSNASENIITIDSVDYLVVQNCYQTTGPSPTDNSNHNQFAAFALT